MNKKLVSLALVGIVLITLGAGCAKKSVYKDGDYSAANPDFDSRGYKPQLTLTIKSDKVTAVNYDEVKQDGSKKSTDQQYAANMKAKTNVAPSEAYSKLSQDLIAKQDPNKVDKVTGATESSANFKKLASDATAKAKNQ